MPAGGGRGRRISVEAFADRRSNALQQVDVAGEITEFEVHDDRIAYEGHHEGSSYLEHLDFIDSIRSGSPAKVTLEDGRLAVAVGQAGNLSIDEGRPVELAEVL